VIHLACDMGGVEWLEANRAAAIMSVQISTAMLPAALDAGVERYFNASSACAYPINIQDRPDIQALRESDAYPAMPEPGYGEHKLYEEQMCRYFREDYGLETRVARFHNVFGTHGSWTGGREKAPAAICRKVAEAVIDGTGSIEIFGDGEQTRSYLAVEECVEGILRITESDYTEPLNLGSAEMVTVNQLVDLVETIAGLEVGELDRIYRLEAPQGVRGRSSDNTLIAEVLGWQPSAPLVTGMIELYEWVFDQVKAVRDRDSDA